MKNPWLSLWLSGANKIAGAARGLMMGEMRRQQSSAVKTAAKAASDAIKAPTGKAKPKKPRRKTAKRR
jgi:hypothetical protein